MGREWAGAGECQGGYELRFFIMKMERQSWAGGGVDCCPAGGPEEGCQCGYKLRIIYCENAKKKNQGRG